MTYCDRTSVQLHRRGCALITTLIEVTIVGLAIGFFITAIQIMIGSADVSSTATSLQTRQPIVRLAGASKGHPIWVQRGFDEIAMVDPVTWRSETVYKDTGMRIRSSCFSPDTSTFILTRYSHEIIIFRGVELLVTESVDAESSLQVALSIDGRIALAVVDGTRIIWWDFSNHEITKSTFMLAERSDQFALNHVGSLFVFANMNGALQLYETCTGKWIRTFAGGEIVTAHPSFSEDGRWLAVACAQTLYLYDLSSGEMVWKFNALEPWWFDCVAISPNAEWIAAVGITTSVYLVKRAGGELAHKLSTDVPSRSLAFERSNEALYVGGFDGSIQKWSLLTGGTDSVKCRNCYPMSINVW